MKVGDKVKGLRFYDSFSWFESMSLYIGVEGTVVGIINDILNDQPYYIEVQFISLRKGYNNADVIKVFNEETSRYENVEYWCYPIKEYIAIQRDEKLKELGIV
jgi:hypothetical protein